MKKITILFSVVMTLVSLASVQAKDITIYVQADQQPNIHFWNVSTETSEWPGVKLTETTTVKNLQEEEVTFYYKTFTGLADDAAISFLFNYDGDADKTADINSVTEDHYYIFKGNHEYEDITAQFRSVEEAVISAVQLPGSYCSWKGDNAPMTLSEEKTYILTPDLSDVSDDNITFKLLVNSGDNWYWLGYNQVKVEAPDGWVQEASSDQNIQLNISAIGTKEYTITAVWGGGDNAATNWTLKIDADADAIISHVQLPGSFNGWNGDNALMVKTESGSYNYVLDLSDVDGTVASFKLLVNDHHWLGYDYLTSITAPDGWVEKEEGDDGNIQLNVATAGEHKFNVIATWAGGKNASAGWSLQVTSTATGINTLRDSQSMTNGYYNLSGQRVAQPLKGLYITNGKKYIVK